MVNAGPAPSIRSGAAPGGGNWFHQHFSYAKEPLRVINDWGGPNGRWNTFEEQEEKGGDGAVRAGHLLGLHEGGRTIPNPRRPRPGPELQGAGPRAAGRPWTASLAAGDLLQLSLRHARPLALHLADLQPSELRRRVGP
jgi:hypothetical protein